MQTKLKNIKKIIIISLITLLTLWFLGFILFTNHIFSYPKNIIYPKDTNAGITALTGGRNRIQKAVELLNNDIGTRLLISGVKPKTTLADITSREDINLNVNYPIDLGEIATDTVGNATEIKQWADKYNINKIYIVTSFYHIPRTKLELERQIPQKEKIFVPTYSNFVSKRWWIKISSFKFLSIEYTKFLIVFIQYKVLGL